MPVLRWLLSVERAKFLLENAEAERVKISHYLSTRHALSLRPFEFLVFFIENCFSKKDRETSERDGRRHRLQAVRSTQPSEPILLPKVRIQVADFPYPHSSNALEAANLGDLMRIWVRSGAECFRRPRGSTVTRSLKPEDESPDLKQRIVMLASDFQGPAVKPRTPLELRCFTV